MANKISMIEAGWLRAVLYILFCGVILMLLSILVASAILVTGKDETASAAENSIGELLAFYPLYTITFIGIAFLFRKIIDKESISSLGFQWKDFKSHAAAGFFLGILLLSVGTIILVLLQYLFFTGVTVDLTNLLYSLLLFILVAFTEEIAFRGYILNNLMQSTNKWIALFISSVLFALFHSMNDHVNVVALLNIFVAGFLLGINYIFTKNLWFAIFLHFSWNFFQGPILGYSVSGIPANGLLDQIIKGPDLLTGGEFGFEGSLICLLINTLTCMLLASYYSGYRTRSDPQIQHDL